MDWLKRYRLINRLIDGAFLLFIKLCVAILLSLLFYSICYAEEGLASWYSEESPGIRETTANMEIFDDSLLTCAIWDMPFGTILKVTNLENGKSVIVRVNDRGPAKRLNRLIDLSKAAFMKIADLNSGIIKVRIEEV